MADLISFFFARSMALVSREYAGLLYITGNSPAKRDKHDSVCLPC